MSEAYLAGLVFALLLCGVIAGAIAGNRGLSVGLYFTLGMFLGIVGIIIAAVAPPPVSAPQPPGWYPDPWRHATWRYYDGFRWTYHMSE